MPGRHGGGKLVLTFAGGRLQRSLRSDRRRHDAMRMDRWKVLEHGFPMSDKKGLFHRELQPAAQSSMVAWFKSEDANPVWKSAVGSWQGHVTKGTITRKVEAGNGATRPVAHLTGLSNAAYDFSKIMKPICSITRYLEGGVMGRILQNNDPNFLHGHHQGRTGLAYYNAWVTRQDVPGNTDCSKAKMPIRFGRARWAAGKGM